jgi:ABC-2 type transport system ATP-binding protein
VIDETDLPSDFGLAADLVRGDIDRGGIKSASRLLQFAETYAMSSQLRDDAVVLQLECRTRPSNETDDLVQRMSALVERIIEDHAVSGGKDAQLERLRAMIQLRERLQRLAPANAEVFVGRGLVKRHARSDFQLGPLNLLLRLGEITGVVGQNAHGKTTLLRLVAGELEADGGSLHYPLLMQDGPDIDWPTVKQHIAFVPQELSPWGGSLADTLHYEASLHGLRGEANERVVRFIVERLGLGGHLDRGWAQLSGGYKVRFALARALVWKPRLLVLDEPLANLDVKAKGVLLQDVRDLARSYSHPIAVIMSSHDLHNLESVCSQMVFLTAGKPTFVGGMAALGDDRTNNQYEISTMLSNAEVQARLRDSFIEDIREDGLNLVLLTDTTRGPGEVMALLLGRGVELRYFRDNSCSIRRLFE